MAGLSELIAERILTHGPITFDAFMDAALYTPGMGYYAKETTEIGRAGDFYTSPHLHQAFGAMLGEQVQEMWEAMGRPSPFTVVEAGAGRGYLAMDMLGRLKGREVFDALSYIIVELSPHMKGRQEELLSEFSNIIEWRTSLSEVGPVTGVILSNELMDAIPVHLVEMGEGGLAEIYVALDGERFVESVGAPSTDGLVRYLDTFGAVLRTGYRTEINLRAGEWLASATSALASGFIITIDYGYTAAEYYDEERDRGTLLCYKEHQTDEDPYSDVGEKDMTAHVNFSALSRWGTGMGLKTLGYATQGTYLVSLGIDRLITELYEGTREYAFEVAKIKGLLLPGTMGETHKVLIQYKGEGAPVLRGFSISNRARAL